MSVATGDTTRVSTASAGATATLAHFVTHFDLSRVPLEAVAVAKMGFQDCIGVALAGSSQPAGRIAAGYVRSQGGAPIASVWGGGFSSSPSLAALANGTAAHALDYDDVNWSLLGHPSTSLTAATLALGEQLDASGRDVLAAYACGFEVMTKIGKSCMPAHSLEGGWHATGTIGTLGATAAAARLLGLDEVTTRQALAVAVSHASGVVRNFGTMSKPLHAGLAAQNAIQAAGLAAGGFTGSPDAVEGTHGFYGSYSRGLPTRAEVLDELGEVWELATTKLVIKPYPCGVAGHPAIDAALRLRERLRPGDLSQLEAMEIGATSYTLDKMRYLVPEDGLQAKFSLPYQVARALADGWVGLSAFTDAAARDEPVQALCSTGRIYLDEPLDAEWRAKGGSRPCRVTLRLRDGRVEEELVRVSKGNPDVPLTDAELHTKFRDCASLALPSTGAVERLTEMLDGLEALPRVRPLCALLRGGETAR